jgi:isoleucyl-tRNA synthetase
VTSFLDVLTNWYIRRSRDRFWDGDRDAIDTLHTALHVLCQVAAPLLPLTTEHIFAGLGDGSSVHLTDWPDAAQFPVDADLVSGMTLVREASTTLLSLRKAEGRRVRLPLAKAVVATAHADLVRPHVEILRDELNVKELVLTDDVDSYCRRELSLNPKVFGPRVGAATQQIIAAHKAGSWRVEGDRVVVGDVALEPGEYDFRLVSSVAGAAATLPGNRGVVVLDTTVTPELEREGVARDLVRLVQQARREAGLHVSDRIAVSVAAGPAWIDALETHRDLVMAETLAVEVSAVVTTAADTDPPRIVVDRR